MEEGERTFTPGQAEAMDALLSGRNVFLSGNAGTGKSYVLNAFIEELEEREVPYLAMASPKATKPSSCSTTSQSGRTGASPRSLGALAPRSNSGARRRSSR